MIKKRLENLTFFNGLSGVIDLNASTKFDLDTYVVDGAHPFYNKIKLKDYLEVAENFKFLIRFQPILNFVINNCLMIINNDNLKYIFNKVDINTKAKILRNHTITGQTWIYFSGIFVDQILYSILFYNYKNWKKEKNYGKYLTSDTIKVLKKINNQGKKLKIFCSDSIFDLRQLPYFNVRNYGKPVAEIIPNYGFTLTFNPL